MNLNDSGEGMVPFKVQEPPLKALEKNIDRKQITMDSTPINDVMGPADMMMDQQPMMAPQMMAQAPITTKQSLAATQNKNPFNLTDEQYQALIAGVCAILAFSNPVQEKLLSAVPQFMAEGGGRSMTGLIATGVIAALIFYFAQRMIIKQ